MDLKSIIPNIRQLPPNFKGILLDEIKPIYQLTGTEEDNEAIKIFFNDIKIASGKARMLHYDYFFMTFINFYFRKHQFSLEDASDILKLLRYVVKKAVGVDDIVTPPRINLREFQNWTSYFSITDRFAEILAHYGMCEYLDAYAQGVPVDDIIA